MPAPGAAPVDLDPRLVRRCTEARRSGQVPNECRRVLEILEQARPGTAVRATPRFTG